MIRRSRVPGIGWVYRCGCKRYVYASTKRGQVEAAQSAHEARCA